ncbi:MAG TPA: hypothetical protein VFD69_03000 [Vicinamibacterales bacterium]|nr:hypothetical protein [Vicinamibacterales bacterium]
MPGRAGTARPWRRAFSGIAARNRLVGLLAAIALASGGVELRAEPVPVRYTEGLVHGFLALRTLEGRTIADGDLNQVASGAQVTARITFRFRDGSLHDETAVYTQRDQFRLLSYRLVQRGASFPRPLEMSIDTGTGQVTVRYTDDEGEGKTESERLELPPDVANGLVSTLLKNVRPGTSSSLSYVAATPKPRLVKLEIAAATPDRFTVGWRGRSATHYVIKVDVGGFGGLIAPLIGKQPPDSHVWILGGDAPAFVRAEQALYVGGPVWRIELTSPTWPRAPRSGDAPAKK